MKALILNSGLGSRMGVLTSEHPKCMTEISGTETILSRQLKQLAAAGVEEVVMTTGLFDDVLVKYCKSFDLPLRFTFVKNPAYDKTNYIYSIYCAREHLDDDIILMHGDLVFESVVLDRIIESPVSCMAVSSTLPLPEKDFKAQVVDGKVVKVGVGVFDNAVAAQALYHLKKDDWKLWLGKIAEFCEAGNTNVYAEEALNELNGAANIAALDVKDLVCAEIDDPDDLETVSARIREVESRTVYMCFASDIIHGGHIAIIKKAQKLGKLIIGVLSDEAVATYKRMPLVPASERKVMFENISGVYKVVDQYTLSYKENLEKYKPDIVVHGDDWCSGFQRPIRDEVVAVLETYGGKLVEYPYSNDQKYKDIDARTRADLAMPDIRRGRLKRMLEAKGLITAMEAHDGLTGLVVENTVVYQDGGARQYDAMWISSLCDSTAKGKPDIELVDMTSRFRTIEDIT
ncbi:MAG: isocitrate lyase/phosphoenolpyruvate mutase family protein, partial [Clostridia bacterium]|nr:isocitrate lyase/phosphoenolpyruvate mutase family protein [Clostridia bacterium]